jgi:hypothetical protein
VRLLALEENLGAEVLFALEEDEPCACLPGRSLDACLPWKKVVCALACPGEGPRTVSGSWAGLACPGGRWSVRLLARDESSLCASGRLGGMRCFA